MKEKEKGDKEKGDKEEAEDDERTYELIIYFHQTARQERDRPTLW